MGRLLRVLDKLKFFLAVSTLVILYRISCHFYGTPFLVMLTSKALSFFTLAAYFTLVLIPIAVYSFLPCWAIDQTLIELSSYLWHICFFFWVLRLYLESRTLHLRKGYYFENWKTFTEMHFQMYLFSYLIFAIFLQGGFFILWVW